MKFNKIILIVMCNLFLIGCSNKDNKIETEIIIDDNIEKGNEEKIEEARLESKKTMKNLIAHKNNIKLEEKVDNNSDLEVIKNSIVEEYIRGINLVKEFCENNSLSLTYEEPIEHRISRFKNGPWETDPVKSIVIQLENLYAAGAESVSYFTNEPELNVELGVNVDHHSIVYKAAIDNINNEFNFKGSKLNEFRTSVVNSADIDFDELNKFIQSVYNKEITIDMRFFNKIDENSYEVIRVQQNNCYYKFVYDPTIKL